MIKYKGYEFGREDEYNVNLYQMQSKEITEGGGGRGMGRPKGTGKFEDRMCFVGHFSSVGGCLHKISLLEIENKEVSDMVNILEDFKKFCLKLQIDFPREQKVEEESVEA
jgi:hypothetical protein